jgi:hypothetical protein
MVSCTKHSSPKKRIVLDGGGKGGNPEVKVINQCFGLNKSARDRCLNIFYPNDINISIYPYNGNIIRLAGRKSSIELMEFNLSKDDRFILYLDSSTIDLPVSCNIKGAKFSKYRKTLVVDMLVDNISNRVTIKDKNGRVLIDYSIVK